jgi:putative oxidoreductase
MIAPAQGPGGPGSGDDASGGASVTQEVAIENREVGTQSEGARRGWGALGDRRLLADIGLLVLRLSLGFEFFAHGMQKFGRFGGTLGSQGQPVEGRAAIDAQADFLDFLGYSPAHALSWFLTFTELIAGILLMAGLLVPMAAAAVIGDSINLIFGLSWQGGWFGNEKGPGYEFSVIMLAAAAALCLLGGGRFSLDRLLSSWVKGRASRWRLERVPWGVAGIVLGIAVGVFVLVVLGPGFGRSDLLPPMGP